MAGVSPRGILVSHEAACFFTPRRQGDPSFQPGTGHGRGDQSNPRVVPWAGPMLQAASPHAAARIPHLRASPGPSGSGSLMLDVIQPEPRRLGHVFAG